MRVRTPHGDVELAGDMILGQGAEQTLEITSPGMVGSEMLNGNFMWDIKNRAVFRTDWAFDINQKKGNLMGVLDVKCFDNDHASFHVVFTKDLAGSSYNANNVQFIYSNSFEQLLGLKKKSPTELLLKNNKLDNPIESPDSIDSGNSVELPESIESGDSIGSSDSAPLTEADSIGSHLVTVAICHGKNATNLIVFGAIQMWDNELFKMSLLFSFIKIVIMIKKLAGNKKGKEYKPKTFLIFKKNRTIPSIEALCERFSTITMVQVLNPFVSISGQWFMIKISLVFKAFIQERPLSLMCSSFFAVPGTKTFVQLVVAFSGLTISVCLSRVMLYPFEFTVTRVITHTIALFSPNENENENEGLNTKIQANLQGQG